jgi:hypothetical protein
MVLLDWLTSEILEPAGFEHEYPLIKEVADIAAHVPYHYDTVYKVWLEWGRDLEATNNVFLISAGMSLHPLDVTANMFKSRGTK